jgi:hypothetical protein
MESIQNQGGESAKLPVNYSHKIGEVTVITVIKSAKNRKSNCKLQPQNLQSNCKLQPQIRQSSCKLQPKIGTVTVNYSHKIGKVNVNCSPKIDKDTDTVILFYKNHPNL